MKTSATSRPIGWGRFSRLAALAVGAAVLAACGSSPGEGADEEVTLLGGSPSFSYVTPQLIDSLDIGPQVGLELTYEGSATNPPLILSAVLRGDVDVANASGSTVLEAVANGQEVMVTNCTMNPLGYLVLRNDIIDRLGVSPNAPLEDRLKALKGLTIVTTPTGAALPATLAGAVEAVGLDPETDLTIVGSSDAAAIVAGVKTRRFDGAFYGPAVLEGNVATGEAQVWINTPQGDLDELLNPGTQGFVIVAKKTAEQRPELVEAIHDMFAKAAREVYDHPDRAAEALKSDWFPKMPEEVFDYVWQHRERLIPPDGQCSRADWDAMVKFNESVTGNSYDAVKYEDVVFKFAQAE